MHPSPRNLLLAVDGSEHAKAATQLVQNLPLPPDCQISIISVLIPRNAQYHAMLTQVLEQTKTQLKQTRSAEVQTHLLTGYPAEQILTYAEENQPDLIVIGARGLRSTLGILLGGVAQNIVEYAHCPVLVVRAPYEGLRRVLLAVDGSEQSQAALQYLQDCPLPDEVSKYLIHVMPPEISADMYQLSWQTSPEMTPPILTEQMQEQILQNAREEENHAQALLEETTAQLEKQGTSAHSVLRRGDAATEIIAFAQQESIDLIMVGSRGLGTFRGWLLGSVSRKLVHYADCSVLIVKPPSN